MHRLEGPAVECANGRKEYAEILKEDPGAPVAGISCPLMQLAKAIGSWCRPFN